jgi:uncharacterized protein (DUF2225 family)
VVDPLFQIDAKCINCEQKFKTSRVRPSFKKVSKRDTDFCSHYKDVNPDYYVVRVCPYCGFAATEHFSERMNEEQKRIFYEKITSRWSKKDYGKERDWESALHTYKLALLCAQIKKESDRVIAGLLHHISWLYRYKGNVEQEERFLTYTLEAYIRVYEQEGDDVNNAKLMYLIGELNRRLRNYNEAVRWFARVINDKKIMDAGMIRACREQWAQMREDMKAEGIEIEEAE